MRAALTILIMLFCLAASSQEYKHKQEFESPRSAILNVIPFFENIDGCMVVCDTSELYTEYDYFAYFLINYGTDYDMIHIYYRDNIIEVTQFYRNGLKFVPAFEDYDKAERYDYTKTDSEIKEVMQSTADKIKSLLYSEN